MNSPSRFPYLPRERKESRNIYSRLCLTFGIPWVLRGDGGREFNCDVVRHLCRWLRADIQFSPANHPRGQGAVERLGGWMLNMLAELCIAWSKRWDQHVSPACWIKRTLPDPTTPNNMTPFELLFGRKPRISPDIFVPLMDATDWSVGLDGFVENRRQIFREVRQALETRHQSKVNTQLKANNKITRESAGTVAQTGDLVLVKESSSNIEWDGSGGKLKHERWTGPWKINKVLNVGLIIEVVMKGRSTRTRHVSAGGIKPFHVRPPDLRHPHADEFAQFAWSADFGLATPSIVAKPLYTLCDRRNVTSATGVPKWEYHGKYRNGKLSQWMAEREVLSSFNRLQLDVFHALWNLCNPHQPQIQHTSSRKRSQPLLRKDALRLFSIGTTVVKESSSKILSGQVYDYHVPYWRVQYKDNNWEKLSRQEVHRMTRSTP